MVKKYLIPLAIDAASKIAINRVKRYGRRQKGLKRAAIKNIAPPTIKYSGAVVKDVIRGAKLKSALKNRGKGLARYLFLPSNLKKAEKMLITSLGGRKQTSNKNNKPKLGLQQVARKK